MTMAPLSTKSLADYIPTWLPVLVAIFSLVAFGVRADAQIRELRERGEIYDQMMVDRTDRMARVEEQLKMQSKTLDRIEEKLDQ